MAGPGPGADPLEASKLNQAMEEEVLRPLAEQLSTVDRLQLRFDPQQTDFARDQIGLRAAAGLRVDAVGWPRATQSECLGPRCSSPAATSPGGDRL